MKSQSRWQPLLALALVSPLACFGQNTEKITKPAEADRNHFSLGPRLLYNVDVKIKGFRGDPPPPFPNSPQDPKTYDDGFIGVDSTGNALDVTSFWRYDNASQYDPAGDGGNGSIAMHHTQLGIAGNNLEDDPQLGFEFTYARDLRELGRGWLGVEAGVGYTFLG